MKFTYVPLRKKNDVAAKSRSYPVIKESALKLGTVFSFSLHHFCKTNKMAYMYINACIG